MTPAAQRIFINTVNGAVTSSLGGSAAADVQFILRAGAKLEVVFHTAGVAVELEALTTGRLVSKSEADGSALFLDTDWTKTGTAEDTVYTFLGEMDSAGLRTALGSERKVSFISAVLFKQPSDAYDGSSLPFDITVHTNPHRSDDAAPLVSQEVTLVQESDGSALECFINGTSVGFLRLTSAAS